MTSRTEPNGQHTGAPAPATTFTPADAGRQVDLTDAVMEQAWRDPRLANVIYHDWEAGTYDEKWCISYDERCIDYVRERFEHVAGPVEQPFARSLEIGAGTGFFSLNLRLGDVIDGVHVTDLSTKMVEVALRNGEGLGLDIEGRAADAERLPYDENTFDLVCGHAVLHHIPDLDRAMREVVRVLKPGGRFVFAGEPSTQGDAIARRLSHLTWIAATNATKRGPLAARYGRSVEAVSASEREAELESVVDIHTFDQPTLQRLALRAGAVDVTTVSDELTASWFGWPVRTFEEAVRPGSLGWSWFQFAYRTWTALNRMDDSLWSKVVPAKYFYNVSVAGSKPRAESPARAERPPDEPERSEPT